MKKLLPILILCVIFAALLLGYTALKKNSGSGSDKTTAADTTYIMIAETNKADIAAIRYTTEDGVTLSLVKTGTKWQNADNDEMPLDQSILENMVKAVASIGATRKIEGGMDNAADYGLDTPTLTVEVRYADNRTVTYTVGDSSAYSGEIYFAVGGDNAVYTVNAAFCDFFDYTVDELAVLDKMAAIKKAEITSVSVATKQGTRTLEGRESEDSDTKTWTLTNESGAETPLEAEAADALLSALLALDLDTCVDYDVAEADLAGYGLDAPVVITINYKREKPLSPSDTNPSTGTILIDSTYEIRVGYASDQKTYVRLQDSNMVFEADLSAIGQLLQETPQ